MHKICAIFLKNIYFSVNFNKLSCVDTNGLYSVYAMIRRSHSIVIIYFDKNICVFFRFFSFCFWIHFFLLLFWRYSQVKVCVSLSSTRCSGCERLLCVCNYVESWFRRYKNLDIKLAIRIFILRFSSSYRSQYFLQSTLWIFLLSSYLCSYNLHC